MIAVVYKGEEGTIQVPAKRLQAAKSKANTLYKQGKLGVKVVNIQEKILYIPEIGK